MTSRTCADAAPYPTGATTHAGMRRRRRHARWFSSQPVRDYVAAQRRRGATLRQLNRAGSIDVRTLQRALSRTRLRADAADRVAVALGLHPSQLWQDWFSGEGA